MIESTSTPSRIEDDLVEHLVVTYDFSKVTRNSNITIELKDPKQLELVVHHGRRFHNVFHDLVLRSIRRYWSWKIAECKVPKDNLELLLEKIDDDSEKTRETLVKQQIVKEQANERMSWCEVFDDVKTNFTTPILKPKTLSRINADSINKLVCFECVIIGRDMQQAITDQFNTTKSGKINCEKYNKEKDGVINFVIYEDVQFLLVEEIDPDSHKKHLRKLPVKIYDGFVNRFETNDRCRIVGFLRTVDIKSKDEKDLFVETVNIEPLDPEKETVLFDQDLEMFRNDSKDLETFFNNLTSAYAPHVFENYTPKLACLLACVGPSDFGPHRSNLHVYLVGNPGIAKSDMLEFASRIRYSSVYTDASNTTSRGLLYSQEEFSKHKILRAGLMIRNDLVCLDEIDKMERSQIQELNNALEQQIGSYHKSPFDIDTPINCTVIASGNPADGRWVKSKSYMQNLSSVPTQFLNRVLIVKVESVSNTKGKIRHILKNIKHDETTSIKYTEQQLAGLISYCRKLNPILTPEAEKIIEEFVIFFETLEQDEDSDIPIETRQEIDLIRVATAIAKLSLKNHVDEQCIRFAIEFYKNLLRLLGKKTASGVSDLNLEGFHVKKEDAFWQIIKDLVKDSEDGTFTEEQILNKMIETKHWKTTEAARGYWNRYEPNHVKNSPFYEPRPGRFKRIEQT